MNVELINTYQYFYGGLNGINNLMYISEQNNINFDYYNARSLYMYCKKIRMVTKQI